MADEDEHTASSSPCKASEAEHRERLRKEISAAGLSPDLERRLLLLVEDHARRVEELDYAEAELLRLRVEANAARKAKNPKKWLRALKHDDAGRWDGVLYRPGGLVDSYCALTWQGRYQQPDEPPPPNKPPPPPYRVVDPPAAAAAMWDKINQHKLADELAFEVAPDFQPVHVHVPEPMPLLEAVEQCCKWFGYDARESCIAALKRERTRTGASVRIPTT